MRINILCPGGHSAVLEIREQATRTYIHKCDINLLDCTVDLQGRSHMVQNTSTVQGHDPLRIETNVDAGMSAV